MAGDAEIQMHFSWLSIIDSIRTKLINEEFESLD